MNEQQRAAATQAFWENPSEENQWAVRFSLSSWDGDKDFDNQPRENAEILIREDPPPAAVKVYEGGTGKLIPGGGARWNDRANKPISGDPAMQPFLFRDLEKRGDLVRFGKLDDESKAMLKEKYNVDVDAPVDDGKEGGG